MKSITLTLSILLLVSSCKNYSTQNGNRFLTVELKSFEDDDGNQIEVLYQLDVPKSYKKVIANSDHARENRMVYSDGSVIYISDDEWRGSGLNFENLALIGVNSYSKKQLYDTINNEGQQKDSKYWRQHLVGQVVVGYINVPPDKKAEYDKALATLRRKKQK